MISEIVSAFVGSVVHDLPFEPLQGGASSALLYRFDVSQHSYVLRLFPRQASSITREHQIQLAKLAGSGDFGPKVHFVDHQRRGLIMDFIPGRTVLPSDFEESTSLNAFALFLKRLHQSESPFPIAVSPFKRFRDFYLKTDERLHFLEIKKLMEELEAVFCPIKLTPTHLDLHPLNIMRSENRFLLVDWVNGGMSDPFFDLATFSVFHDLDESRQWQFLKSYFEDQPTDWQWHRFIATQPVRLLVIAFGLFSVGSNEASSYYQRALGIIEQAPFRSAHKFLTSKY